MLLKLNTSEISNLWSVFCTEFDTEKVSDTKVKISAKGSPDKDILANYNHNRRDVGWLLKVSAAFPGSKLNAAVKSFLNTEYFVTLNKGWSSGLLGQLQKALRVASDHPAASLTWLAFDAMEPAVFKLYEDRSVAALKEMVKVSKATLTPLDILTISDQLLNTWINIYETTRSLKLHGKVCPVLATSLFRAPVKPAQLDMLSEAVVAMNHGRRTALNGGVNPNALMPALFPLLDHKIFSEMLGGLVTAINPEYAEQIANARFQESWPDKREKLAIKASDTADSLKGPIEESIKKGDLRFKALESEPLAGVARKFRRS